MSEQTNDANREKIGVDDIVWIPATITELTDPQGLGHLILHTVHESEAYPNGTRINMLAQQVEKYPRGYVWEAAQFDKTSTPDTGSTGAATGAGTTGAVDASDKKGGGSGT